MELSLHSGRIFLYKFFLIKSLNTFHSALGKYEVYNTVKLLWKFLYFLSFPCLSPFGTVDWCSSKSTKIFLFFLPRVLKVRLPPQLKMWHLIICQWVLSATCAAELNLMSFNLLYSHLLTGVSDFLWLKWKEDNIFKPLSSVLLRLFEYLISHSNYYSI